MAISNKKRNECKLKMGVFVLRSYCMGEMVDKKMKINIPSYFLIIARQGKAWQGKARLG